MIPRTVQDLAVLPNERLMRRQDALARLWQVTPSASIANRAHNRLMQIREAARAQMWTSFQGTALDLLP
jgi:hypothetical protein